MSSLTYSSPPGRGTELSNKNYYSQAVVLPTTPLTIKISGQGGWDPTTWTFPSPSDASSTAEQVDLAFSNVNDVLRHAGSKNGWGDVYLARVYVVDMPAYDMAVFKATVESMKKWAPNHMPLLTFIEVKGLALEAMRIEIEVEALLG